MAFAPVQADMLKTSIVTPKGQHKNDLRHSTDYKKIINHFEKANGIPEGLLYSLAKVESNYNPWAINSNGKSYFPKSKAEGIKILKMLRRKGYKIISIGLCQINYAAHGHEFKNIADMLDPYVNISYAARYFKKLKRLYKTWRMAIIRYHSPNPLHYNRYLRKVRLAWVERLKGLQKLTAPAQSTIFQETFVKERV